VWCLIYSWYANLNYGHFNGANSGSGHSLMTAAEPWSGYYEVSPPVQVIAHWTQFAKRGWSFLTNGAGIGALPGGGGYTTVINTHVPAAVIEFSVVVTTMEGASAAQTVTFTIANATTGGAALPAALHVWTSNQTAAMVQLADVPVAADGTFTLTLQPNSMYSVTTTTGQGWVQPATPIPPSQPFPFPYSDAFDSYTEGAYATYLSDMGGVWVVETLPAGLTEAKPVAAGAAGASQQPDKAIHQVVPMPPIAWVQNPNPCAVIGNPNPNTYDGLASWTDYTVSANGAFDAPGDSPSAGNYVTLQEECSASVATQHWLPQGGDVTNTPAFLESAAFPGMCLGILDSDPAYQTAMWLGLVPCNRTTGAYPAVQWALNAATKQLQYNGFCVDVLSQNTSIGASTIAYPCETPAGINEQWSITSSGGAGSPISFVSAQTGYCVDLHLLPPAGGAFLWLTTRISSFGWNPYPDGYSLYVKQSTNATTAGSWSLQYASAVLASGATAFAVSPNTWYTLGLQASGHNITATLNGATLATVTSYNSSFGNVAVGSGWHGAWWDDLSITA